MGIYETEKWQAGLVKFAPTPDSFGLPCQLTLGWVCTSAAQPPQHDMMPCLESRPVPGSRKAQDGREHVPACLPARTSVSARLRDGRDLL